VSGTGLRAYPPRNQGIRVVPIHSRSSEGEGLTVRGNADCCHPPYRDGRVAHRVLGSYVFRCTVCAQALTH
jgi:hypothetical protein